MLAFDDDGIVVGMASGYRPGPVAFVELVSMWTAPPARGLGVGAMLVDAVVGWARETAAGEVQLWVMRDNDTARRLYERCGFTVTDAVGVSDDDPCRDEIRMMLAL